MMKIMNNILLCNLFCILIIMLKNFNIGIYFLVFCNFYLLILIENLVKNMEIFLMVD